MVPAKLEIVRDYGKEYSRILAKQELLSHAYIDAFTGPGVHVLRTTGEMVVGSPVNALEISPPFADYYFIDTDGDKVGALRRLAGGPRGCTYSRATATSSCRRTFIRTCVTRTTGDGSQALTAVFINTEPRPGTRSDRTILPHHQE